MGEKESMDSIKLTSNRYELILFLKVQAKMRFGQDSSFYFILMFYILIISNSNSFSEWPLISIICCPKYPFCFRNR